MTMTECCGSPEEVKEFVGKCLAAGATRVSIEFSGAWAEADACWFVTGRGD